MASAFRFIDLFAGCGGITQGFVSSGLFRPVAAVEIDLHAAATYAANFGDHVHVGDIQEWVHGSVPAAHVVVGGPPCQGFSALGRRRQDDPRNLMWRHYVSVLRRARPAFFVMENVPQFLEDPEFAALVEQTRAGGGLHAYELEAHVLNANDYGTPQRRRRAIVIGRLRELREVGPPPVGTSPVLGEAFPAWLQGDVDAVDLPHSVIEFRDCLVPGAFKTRELHCARPPTPLALARYASIPPGGSRWDLPEHLQTDCWRNHTSGAGDVMGRMDWGRPSVTIRTEFFKPEKGRYLHPEQNRAITHAEGALIQGFPEDFLWCGTKATIARQIGNAVPPPMARAIAEHLAERLV